MTEKNAENIPDISTRPFSRFEWIIATRYLRPKRKEAFISVIAGFSFIGIMLGVTALIVVMAVMNGFRSELLERILGVNGHMIVQPIENAPDDINGITSRIKAVDGVDFVVPLVEGMALVSGNFGNSGVRIRGIREKELLSIETISNNIKQGSIADFDIQQGVIIGSRLAKSLGVHLGDNITLTSPDGDVTAFGVTPRIKSYPVLAIFEIGMSEYDSSFIFMPLQEAQLYFNMPDRITVFEVYLDDPEKTDYLRNAVETAAIEPVFITDWKQLNRTFFSALEVERNVMFLILILIIVVAALNIISGLTMLVKEKSKDIAILRTMGVTRSSILRIFFITGAIIGLLGTFSGVILGITICAYIENIREFFSWLSGTSLFNPEIYFLSQLPVDVDTSETVSVVLIALILSFLATLIPALQAARLDPVEALRYE